MSAGIVTIGQLNEDFKISLSITKLTFMTDDKKVLSK